MDVSQLPDGRWFSKPVPAFGADRANRRRFTRHRYGKIASVVWIDDAGRGLKVQQVKVADLSRGGVQLTSVSSRSVGDRGAILLRVDDDRGLLCGVTVRRVETMIGIFTRLRCQFSEPPASLVSAVSIEGCRMRLRDDERAA